MSQRAEKRKQITDTVLAPLRRTQDPDDIIKYAATLISRSKYYSQQEFIIELTEILEVVASKHKNMPSTILSVCELLQTFSNNFNVGMMAAAAENASNTEIGLFTLLKFVWSFCDHHLCGVRRCCANILKNLLLLGHTAYCFKNIVVSVRECSESSDVSRDVQYTALRGLCDVADSTIMELNGYIRNKFLTYFVENNNNDFYKDSMCASLDHQSDTQNQIDKWILPLVQLCLSSDDKAVTASEELIKVVILRHPKFLKYLYNQPLPLRSKVHLNFVERFFLRRGKKLVGKTFTIAEDGIRHSDQRVRIKAFKILTTCRTNFVMNNYHLDLLFSFLKMNINNYDNTKELVNGFTKVFKRIKRDVPRIRNNKTKRNYIGFVRRMWNELAVAVRHTVNKVRFANSLHLMMQMAKHCKRALPKFKVNAVHHMLLRYKKPVHKDICTVILRHCPIDRSRTDSWRVKNMMKAIVTNDVSTINSYIYQIKYSVMSKVLFKDYSEPIALCVKSLSDARKETIKSLDNAIDDNPMFGTLSCLRLLLENVDLPSINKKKWTSMLKEIIQLCIQISEVLLPVVADGTLVGDIFGNVNVALIDHDDPMMQNKIECSWRCIHESSLILRNIALRAPLDHRKRFVTEGQMYQIGDYFTKMMCFVKHKTAFETASYGYEGLCERLSKSGKASWNEIPMTWWREIVGAISGKSPHALNGRFTRENPNFGVPYILKIIVYNQMKWRGQDFKQEAISVLYNICLNCPLAISRIYSIKTLQMLFDYPELMSVLKPEFISDGIKTSLRCYRLEEIDERNACAELFATLLIRIFGVQRIRDFTEINLNNRVTVRSFFVCYPDLLDFFVDELNLEKSNKSLSNDDNSLFHPMLMILSRLYTPPAEWTELDAPENIKLLQIIELISDCADNPNPETRVLAARSYAALNSPLGALLRAGSLVKRLPTSVTEAMSCNENDMHAKLLQFRHLLKLVPIGKFGKGAHNDFLKVRKYIERAIDVYDYDVELMEIFAKCAIEVLKKAETSSPYVVNFAEVLNEKYKEMVLCLPRCPEHDVLIKPSIILMMMCKFIIGEPIDDILCANLEYMPTEYSETILNICILVIDYPRPRELSEADLAITRMEFDYVMEMPQDYRNTLRNILLDSETLRNSFEQIQHTHPRCTAKLYNVLSRYSVCEASNMALLLLVDGSTDNTDEEQAAILTYFNNAVKKRQIKTNYIQYLLMHLSFCIRPARSQELRMATARIIATFYLEWPTYLAGFRSDKCTHLSLTIDFLMILLELLRDNSEPIRDIMSETVIKLTKTEGINENVVCSYAELLLSEFIDRFLHTLGKNDRFCVAFSLACGVRVMLELRKERANDLATQKNLFVEYYNWQNIFIKHAQEALKGTIEIIAYMRLNLTQNILDTMMDFIVLGNISVNFEIYYFFFPEES